MSSEEAADLRAVVDEMAEVLGTKLSFGYIGNVWHAPYLDDRHWLVWFEELPRGLQDPFYNNKPSISVGTARDGYLKAQDLRKRLISAFFRLKAKMEGREDLVGFRYARVPR